MNPVYNCVKIVYRSFLYKKQSPNKVVFQLGTHTNQVTRDSRNLFYMLQ